MSINMGNTSNNQNGVTVIEEPQVLDINKHTGDLKLQLRNAPEVQALTNQINVQDLDSILIFGKDASAGISKVSDSLLNTMKAIKSEEGGEMLVQLTKIMDKFDIKDFQEAKEPSIFQKLFNKVNNAIEAMFQKYETLGGEVDKIYVILKKYEQDIQQSNKNLRQMFNTNLSFYDELQKYIVAGELAIEEMDNQILPQFKSKAEQSGDQMDMLNYQQLTQVKEVLEQRVYDLRIAENIALQTIPMIQGMQLSNYNLVRKINSAFVITLPIFKQCLAQAVMLKRQELQAKSMKALDDKTNELLIRNAQNVAKQNVEITKLAGTSSVQIETLEKTWNTIMNGIQETKMLQEKNKADRVSNKEKLENMNNSIINQNQNM
ncbi:TPA: toxic anion resistance protein [Clostridium botulinum]|nr:toxic anion resistance protein [Clostridium botulinum]